MKRGQIILVGVVLVLLIVGGIFAKEINVGVSVDGGSEDEGWLASIFGGGLLKFLNFLGMGSGSVVECESGYGDECPPAQECWFLVGCIEGECEYDYVDEGTPCGDGGVCDSEGECAPEGVVGEEFGVCGEDCVGEYSC